MQCPRCTSQATRVIDSRPAERGTALRRRRSCPECRSRFTTYERVEPVLMVLKRSGRMEPFDSQKLRRGLASALADRPVSPVRIDEIVDEVEAGARTMAPQVPSDALGRALLEHLRVLDEVAYLRFASVYKDFQGARDFEREMAVLEDDPSGR
ncbi:MAG: transcriptional regulator NrdR [Acidimicrobiia bacterium]